MIADSQRCSHALGGIEFEIVTLPVIERKGVWFKAIATGNRQSRGRIKTAAQQDDRALHRMVGMARCAFRAFLAAGRARRSAASLPCIGKLGADCQGDSATGRKFRGHNRFARRQAPTKSSRILLVTASLNRALVSVGSQIKFQRFALDAEFCRDIFDGDLSEIHLPGHRTERCKISRLKTNAVIAFWRDWGRSRDALRKANAGRRVSLLPRRVRVDGLFRFAIDETTLAARVCGNCF